MYLRATRAEMRGPIRRVSLCHGVWHFAYTLDLLPLFQDLKDGIELHTKASQTIILLPLVACILYMSTDSEGAILMQDLSHGKY